MLHRSALRWVSSLGLTLASGCLPAESAPGGDAGPSTPAVDAATGGQSAMGGTHPPLGGTGGTGGGTGGVGGPPTGGAGGATGGVEPPTGGGTGGGAGGATGGTGGGEPPTGGTGGQVTGGAGGEPGADSDADGLADTVDNCPARPNPSQRDADTDGRGDACDPDDTDHDGVPDDQDLCPAVDVRPLDTDADGVGDQCDLCPENADATQRDGDGDGRGDACDTPDDDDGDELSAAMDNCPSIANRDQSDVDADGIGDACDDCPRAPDFSQRDGDRDGLGDACDPCPAAPVLGDDHADLDQDGVPACAADCDDGAPTVYPGAPERCDGLDNDCGGAADDVWPELGQACLVGQGACQRQGVVFCADEAAATCSAVPGRPGVEACNRLDDDCDGRADEELANCCQPGETTPCGADVGVCQAGLQTCLDNRTWGACSGQGPAFEVCNGLDDDCNGVQDDGLPPVVCGLGQCAHPVVACANGRPGPCQPLEGALAETCNQADDDCDGVVDEGFDLNTDPLNCGRCGNACGPGAPCENGRCGGRNVVLRCGDSERDTRTFLRGPAAGLQLSVGCVPDEHTVAMLVTRSGASLLGAAPESLRDFLNGGGAIIGEYDTTTTLVPLLLQVPVPPQGPMYGDCNDELMPRILMNAEDPLWRDSGLQPLVGGRSGCGFGLQRASIPGLVPLGSDAPDHVMLGYVEVGRGRLWLVESDWQDRDNLALSHASLDLMGWMIAGWRPSNLSQCQNGFDDDADGDFDLWDAGCTGPNDATEGNAGPTACSDGQDNNVDGGVDYPYDPGCLAAGDPTEAAPVNPPACFNGIDDDRDGAADFPADVGCNGAADTDETFAGRALACADGLDNDADGGSDYPQDLQCTSFVGQSESRAGGGQLLTAPFGVQADLPVAALAQWRVCYQATYRDGATPVANILGQCDGEEVILGCRRTGGDVLVTAAGGPRNDVFFDVGADAAASHVANGVAFYFDQNSSLGFAPAGTAVNRSTCDTQAMPGWGGFGEDDGTGHLRLCWHTSMNNMQSGFRCGLTSDYDNAHERMIFTR